jgi:hypothetical protein
MVISICTLSIFSFLSVVKKNTNDSKSFERIYTIFRFLILTGLIFFRLEGLLKLYPQYNDLLNGFTYNGHDYIAAFIVL